MKIFNWNEEKNKTLKGERHICFEEIIILIEQGSIIEIYEHPDKKNYPEQKIYAIEINQYIYLVPFIETEKEIFLKTIIPSRKATKKYLK